MSLLNKFVFDENGQDLVEYSLLLVFLALSALAILPTLGNSINVVFSRTNSAIEGGS